ncbi:hypothetical protein [Aliivibrio fischeri]|uniref:hypothetical protein n=1 Tax=Aliivibrio fischeri TaxID=668 RepID=UPI00080E5495|nr:hypothetical protein [Aliivibrio fischeri]OCH36195.1 hypothetical protein A6E02_19015 [Aliivibrio fischeri]
MKNLIRSFYAPADISFEIGKLFSQAIYDAQSYRAHSFVKTIDTRYESMSEDERVKFKAFVESEFGKKITADFASAVSGTPSRIVNITLALLYIGDHDFVMSQSELERFVSSAEGLIDVKVDFFIQLSNIPPLEIDSLFPTYVINSSNYNELGLGVELDELFLFVADFKSRGLILDETNQQKVFGYGSPTKKDDWEIKYSLSNSLLKYAALFNKAKQILR